LMCLANAWERRRLMGKLVDGNFRLDCEGIGDEAV